MYIKVLKFIPIPIIVIVFLFLFIFFNTAPKDGFKNLPQNFKIETGESTYKTIYRLADQKYIKNRFFAKFIVKISNSYFKKGLYEIKEKQTTIQLIKMFKHGSVKMVRFTIPEGYSLKKTANLIESLGFCSAQTFITESQNLNQITYLSFPVLNGEGFLFPDTYTVPAEASAAFLIKAIHKNFMNEVTQIYSAELLTDFKWFYQKLILASIIEKEYKINSEAALISSVFINRLKKNMPLQSCATIKYIITDIENKPHPSRIYYKDLELKSSYNTYRNKGLPPTPICSPGKIALKAALSPASTEFLYFVVHNPNTGEHQFSTNFLNHKKGKTEYLNQYLN